MPEVINALFRLGGGLFVIVIIAAIILPQALRIATSMAITTTVDR